MRTPVVEQQMSRRLPRAASPVLCTQYEVRGARCAVRCTQYGVPRKQSRVLTTQHRVLGTQYQVLSTQDQVPSTQDQVPTTQYVVPDTLHLVPRTQYRLPGPQYRIPLPQYLRPGTPYRSRASGYTISGPKTNVRRAFTLLEVMLALALTAVLMLAVWAAVDLHWKFAETGREEMERAQLARAIFKKMQTDIRSVVFRPPDPASESIEDSETGGAAEGETESGGSSSSGSEETAEVTLADEDLDLAFSNAKLAIGIVGNSTKLLLNISRPSQAMSTVVSTDPDAFVAPESDLRAVQYFLSGGDVITSIREPGLVRREGDLVAMQQADLVGDASTLSTGDVLLAGEVTHLEFAYYGYGPSGLAWLSDWDSRVYGLPLAVKITLGFATPDGNLGPYWTRPSLTVYVPLADSVPPGLEDR